MMEALGYLEYLTVHWRGLLIGAAVVAATLCILYFVNLFNNRRLLRRRKTVWLEVIPPSSIDKTPDATEQLFAVIHGSYAARSVPDKLLGRVPTCSFEIVSTKAEGIRYLIQAPEAQAQFVRKAVSSYVHDAKVTVVDYSPQRPDSVIAFKQRAHYVLPLSLPILGEQHDPLSYVTGLMTKLEDGEQIGLQLIVRPVKLREASRLSHKILGNENILEQVGGKQGKLLQGISAGLFHVASGITDMTTEVYHGTTSSYETSNKQTAAGGALVSKRDRPERTLSAFELELMESMHRKVTQPLFQVDLRVTLRGGQLTDHLAAFRSALDSYSLPPYQALQAKHRYLLLSWYRRRLVARRMPAVFRRQSLILSKSELAGLYHFPSSQVSRTDNLITSLSRTLPAPVSLKSGRPLAVTIGENIHHGIITPIGLSEAERERHVYIIGGTGNGKTTMLFYGILQDIRAGNGMALLDPHGDLAERILRYIPEDRLKDVIYMNPDDLTYPIGMNLLELSEVSGDELLREKDLITEATISVLRKIFSDDDSGGHRIEYVLRNAIQTALTLKDPTLFTIFHLLNDAKYRRKVVTGIEDKNLKDFWDNELGKAGEFQRVKMAAGITAKIGRFLFSASARRVLEQPKSTISFEDILATRKILICNFSKGLLGEDTSTLFGTTVLAKLQTAALRRARISQDNRIPFYLYVDEFQNFATTSFVQMLSEARKYKLYLTMAEQSTSQQDQQRLVDVILANVGTVVCFRSGSPADERLILPLFVPFIQQGEIANLPAYSYYARVAAVEAQEPMSGVTVVVEDTGSDAVAQRVVESSRTLYAKKSEEEQVVKRKIEAVEKLGASKRARTSQVAENGDDELTEMSSFS